MSVFQKLKGSFQNAQQDIVEGLRSLATLDTQPKLDQLRGARGREINLDAGADLLLRYQKTWRAIQADTKESAIKAGEVGRTLVPMFKSWDRQARSVTQFGDEVKAIPALLSTLVQLQQLLDGLRQDFLVAERELDLLEDLCEEQDHRQRIAEEERKLALYALQKDNEYERLKVDLAQRHARKMAQAESVKREKLSERAEAFTSAFKEDLEFYRTHGRPERQPTEFPKVSSLSEIEIEEDKQALDTFLASGAEVETTQVEGTAGAEAEATAEDTYFEDDYIEDYNVKEDAEFVSDIDHLTAPAKIDAMSVEVLDDTDDEEQAAGDAAQGGDGVTGSSKVSEREEKVPKDKGGESLASKPEEESTVESAIEPSENSQVSKSPSKDCDDVDIQQPVDS